MFERNVKPKGPAALALALSLAAVSGLAASASSPDLPPNAGGYVALCPDAATGGLHTIIVPAEEAEAAMTAGTAAAPCAAAPPASAYGPAIDPAKGYVVQELADGVYLLTEGTYQVMFVTTGEGVIVVDAPPSIGPNILAAIAEVTDEPITHVIYSHSHADHIAAAGLYPPDATYIAHADTAAQLEGGLQNEAWGAFVGGGPVPLPTVTFDDAYTLTVGSRTLELSTPDAVAHEPGNIFIYAPAQKVLMFVDVVFPGWSPFKSLALAEDVPGYLAVHDEILGFDFDHLIAGHVGRPGTREDVEINQEYMTDIQGAAAQALGSVDFMAIAQETGFANPWLLFDTYLDAVAHACEQDVVPRWVDRLGGADVFTADHCFKIAESLRID